MIEYVQKLKMDSQKIEDYETEKKTDFFTENKRNASFNLNKLANQSQRKRDSRQKEIQKWGMSGFKTNRSTSLQVDSIDILNKMKDAPPAGVVLSPIYRKKMSEVPQVNDFMNIMFANKTHKSFMLRHQADQRTKYLEGKAFQGQQDKIK